MQHDIKCKCYFERLGRTRTTIVADEMMTLIIGALPLSHWHMGILSFCCTRSTCRAYGALRQIHMNLFCRRAVVIGCAMQTTKPTNIPQRPPFDQSSLKDQITQYCRRLKTALVDVVSALMVLTVSKSYRLRSRNNANQVGQQMHSAIPQLAATNKESSICTRVAYCMR